MIINTGREDAICQIDKIEKKYNAKWVGQLPLRTKSGGWSEDSCGDVYYQETPPIEGYSNYFALIMQLGSLYITSGASAVEGIINAVEANDGEVIYSRYRHDMRYSKDKSVFIDGGRDYIRSSLGAKPIQLVVFEDRLIQYCEVD